jgi:adenosylhomocysteine nucleosidase
MRALLACPIPLEFTSCRTVLSLRDAPPVLGCRVARGTVGNVEVAAVETGPAKARAASATVAAIAALSPDVVMDTGTCGALDGDLIVGGVVIAESCLEYDISGTGLPHRIIPEMKLPSSFALLPRRESEKLVRAAIEHGKDLGLHVRSGVQACGEFFIQSTQVRESLRALTGALAANWETAGVFIGALRSRVPAISVRIVTDHGDEDSLKEFKSNARGCTQHLYGYLRSLVESGWLASFHAQWMALAPASREKMSRLVLP